MKAVLSCLLAFLSFSAVTAQDFNTWFYNKTMRVEHQRRLVGYDTVVVVGIRQTVICVRCRFYDFFLGTM